MPILIVQAEPVGTREDLGKALVDAMVEQGFDHSKIVVIFQEDKSSMFTTGTGYVTPESLRPVHFAGKRSGGSSPRETYNKEELKSKVVVLLNERKDISMTETAYALKISNETWGGAALRAIFTELEQEDTLTKTGEKRGTRYILKESVEEENV